MTTVRWERETDNWMANLYSIGHWPLGTGFRNHLKEMMMLVCHLMCSTWPNLSLIAVALWALMWECFGRSCWMGWFDQAAPFKGLHHYCGTLPFRFLHRRRPSWLPLNLESRQYAKYREGLKNGAHTALPAAYFQHRAKCRMVHCAQLPRHPPSNYQWLWPPGAQSLTGVEIVSNIIKVWISPEEAAIATKSCEWIFASLFAFLFVWCNRKRQQKEEWSSIPQLPRARGLCGLWWIQSMPAAGETTIRCRNSGSKPDPQTFPKAETVNSYSIVKLGGGICTTPTQSMWQQSEKNWWARIYFPCRFLDQPCWGSGGRDEWEGDESCARSSSDWRSGRGLTRQLTAASDPSAIVRKATHPPHPTPQLFLGPTTQYHPQSLPSCREK